MIAAEALERVKAASAIVAIVGREVELKRTGQDFTALCPFHEERTPSFHVHPGRQTFKCFGCGEQGDVFDFLERRHGWTLPEAVRALAAEVGIRVDETDQAPAPRPATPRPAPRAPEPPKRLPVAELEALWAATVPVSADPEVAEYLRVVRRLAPDDVELWGVARALPEDVPTPRWARAKGRSWTESGHRLLFRTFDTAGRFAGLRARCVRDLAAGEQKTLAPAGASTKGLVLADPLAQQLLRGELDRAVPAVAIVEGEMDLLAALTMHMSDADEDAPALLGVVADSWTPELAARIPDGATVVAWTHDDAPGERYASAIADTLAGRCRVRRGVFPAAVPA